MIHFVSDLPSKIWGGSLVQFEGLPTYVGGYTETQDESNVNQNIYQYHWNEDKWVQENTLLLHESRFFAATFEVPRDIMGLC